MIAVALIAATFLYYDAGILTLAKTTLVAFWLVVLPGTFLVSILLKKSLRSLETWVIGTAVGINLLPLGFTIGAAVTTEAPIVWWVVGGAISVFNLISLARLKSRPEAERGQPLPFALITIVCFTFLALFLFQHFSRNASSGNYTYSTYFGGDIPFLAAFITNFERTTILQDLHFGGARMYYHDFTLRLQAGLHFLRAETSLILSGIGSSLSICFYYSLSSGSWFDVSPIQASRHGPQRSGYSFFLANCPSCMYSTAAVFGSD